MNNKLDCVMKPTSVALIGASTKSSSVGHEILKKMLELKYTGSIYPVNPKAEEILGLKCYKNVNDIPGEVDLAVISVPRDGVFTVIDDCAKKNIKGVVVISAGFKEIGGEGLELELKLKEQCEKYGMLVVGPNCMGIINTEPNTSLNATFAPQQPLPGKAAFVSQSGALGIAVLNVAKDMNIGLSQFVSMGNKMIITGNDLLEYWEEDPNINIILMYLESIENPKDFQQLCERISKKKPIIIVKSGTSAAGAAAASSHTGALAGADKAVSAMLGQCGVIRENTMLDMFEVAQAFANCPLPKSNKMAILTNAGGPGIMGTDAAISYGLEIAKLDPQTVSNLKQLLPPQASTRNPVDTIAAVSTQMYCDAMDILIQDPNVDSLIALLVPLVHIDAVEVARTMMKAQKKYNKPVLGVMMSSDEVYKQIYNIKDEAMIPFYKFPESAAYALSKMHQYSQWKNTPVGSLKTFNDVNKSSVAKIISAALSENRNMLTTLESMDILKAYGIKTCKYAEALNPDDAVEKANEIGFPVVMKILSKTVSHKSDVGGVVVNIQNPEQLKSEYNRMMNKAKELKVEQYIHAVMIQEMIKGKREIVLGNSKDAQFGNMMMFGLGGIFIEAMKDVNFKIHPITDKDAEDMINSIKASKLIKGFRGLKAVDMNDLKDQLMRLSQLLSDFSFIDELDINPYILTDDTGDSMAVDGRIKLGITTIEEMNKLLSLSVCK